MNFSEFNIEELCLLRISLYHEIKFVKSKKQIIPPFYNNYEVLLNNLYKKVNKQLSKKLK